MLFRLASGEGNVMRGMPLASEWCVPASGECVQRPKSTTINRRRSEAAKQIGPNIARRRLIMHESTIAIANNRSAFIQAPRGRYPPRSPRRVCTVPLCRESSSVTFCNFSKNPGMQVPLVVSEVVHRPAACGQWCACTFQHPLPRTQLLRMMLPSFA